MKDYYAILGVTPSAEEVVIRAAWKALSQRYHPDRFSEGMVNANDRMAEINEAYSVLSDPVKRKTYDESRGKEERDFGDWVHEEEADQAVNGVDPLEKDWSLAVEYYPDLEKINERLAKISKLLSFTYRASLLELKKFDRRKEFAQEVEKNFLVIYFGNNPLIVNFARELILNGNKLAAKALNNAVRVLGSGVQPDVIINKIRKGFNIVTGEIKVSGNTKAMEKNGLLVCDIDKECVELGISSGDVIISCNDIDVRGSINKFLRLLENSSSFEQNVIRLIRRNEIIDLAVRGGKLGIKVTQLV
jgi:hypothetical protein